ncbi:UbiA prenyltransferase [Mycena latifolia]|nr:UbiA prenyltransferase [Mycena latifolia]
MAYKTHPEISAARAIHCALTYVPLCFGIKGMIMSIDDLLDYDIDALVERTKDRALPRGAISLARAWMFFGLQVVIGVYLAIKVLSKTALYTSMAVWPLYVIYPTCKIVNIVQGLMFKVGIFMGWSDISVDGVVPWHVLAPIYLGACLWTFSYETVYQCCDKLDDMKIGINSPAICCMLNGQGILFYASVVVAGMILVGTLQRTDIDSPTQCKTMFLTTPLIGQIVLLGLVADAVVHRYAERYVEI